MKTSKILVLSLLAWCSTAFADAPNDEPVLAPPAPAATTAEPPATAPEATKATSATTAGKKKAPVVWRPNRSGATDKTAAPNGARAEPEADAIGEEEEWAKGYLWGLAGMMVGTIAGALIGGAIGLSIDASDNGHRQVPAFALFGVLGGGVGSLFGLPAGIHIATQSRCEEYRCPKQPGNYWHAFVGQIAGLLTMSVLASTGIESGVFPLLYPLFPVAAYQIGREPYELARVGDGFQGPLWSDTGSLGTARGPVTVPLFSGTF